ncbi:MAG: alpha/beta fold hydrolase [Rubrobacteraceae bacterium]
MVAILILVLVLAVLFVVASLFLGRSTHEVERARDTEYVELDGSYIRYRVTGAGPPLLLVHGWLLSSRIWDRLSERLSAHFTVYSLDLKGFGDSDKPLLGYGVRHGGRLLYSFCARFGLRRATVVGHDIGGGMAVKLAIDHPEMVGRLVLISVPAQEEQIDLPTLLWLTTLPAVGPAFYALGGLLRLLRSFWLRNFVLYNRELTGASVEDAGKSVPAAVRKTYDAVRQEISDGRLVNQARGIGVPVLLVAGEEDQIVDPASVETWAAVFARAETSLIRRCGHLPMIERPDDLSSLILDFLGGNVLQSTQPARQPEAPPERTLQVDSESEEAEEPQREQQSPAGGDASMPLVGNGRDDERSRRGLEPRQRGSIPVPDDLFDWPEPYSSRTRKDERKPSESESGEAEDEPPRD